MSLTFDVRRALALRLHSAELTCTPVSEIAQWRLQYPSFDHDEGYAVQDALLDLKRENGARHIGFKIGVTSIAQLQQIGIHEPLTGFLLASGALADRSTMNREALIHPRIEPEIAFVLGKALHGPYCSVADVLAATEFVVPALEIIDSRFPKGDFHSSWALADNMSTARHVTGNVPTRLDGLDLSLVGMAVWKNGALHGTAAGAAVMGHPAASLALLANTLARRGRSIPAGSLVLSGGLVPAFPVDAGDTVTARFGALGDVSVQFE
jgi:2-oxo-3-hexenedioate decarboxylase